MDLTRWTSSRCRQQKKDGEQRDITEHAWLPARTVYQIVGEEGREQVERPDILKAEGRKGLAIPGDLRDEKFCEELVRRTVDGLGGLDIVVSQCRLTSGASIDHRSHDGGFWRDDESQHLRTVLDHQGGVASPQARLRHHRHDLGAGLRSSPDLYDYAQTKAATMNYVTAPKVFASMASRRGQFDFHCRCPAERRWKKLEKFGSQTSLGRPGSRPSFAFIYVQLAAADAYFATGELYGSAGGTGQP